MDIKRIPKFRSYEEEAKFWDTHSPLDFPGEFKEITNVKFPEPRQKRLISLRLEEWQIQSLKKIAKSKGIGYLTMIRLWIIEHLNSHAR